MKKIILRVLVFLLIGIQLIPVDQTNPASDPKDDFITQLNPPKEIANILKTSCYDCHSNEVVYPWYTNIAPLKFWINNHIKEGKGHLNFSEWGTYSLDRAQHKLEECIEMVEDGEMPIDSYTLMHGDAELSGDQKTKLIEWLEVNYTTLRKAYILEKITGEYTDDYDIKHSITETTWQQDTLNTFHLLKWNYEDLYIIAKNDSANPSQKGLFSRIDITSLRDQEPYEWGFCLSTFDAASIEGAEKSAAADGENLKEGCNGYPFSKMKPNN
jgi:hypothetical protein